MVVSNPSKSQYKQLSQFSAAAADVGRKLSATLAKLKPLTQRTH